MMRNVASAIMISPFLPLIRYVRRLYAGGAFSMYTCMFHNEVLARFFENVEVCRPWLPFFKRAWSMAYDVMVWWLDCLRLATATRLSGDEQNESHWSEMRSFKLICASSFPAVSSRVNGKDMICIGCRSRSGNGNVSSGGTSSCNCQLDLQCDVVQVRHWSWGRERQMCDESPALRSRIFWLIEQVQVPSVLSHWQLLWKKQNWLWRFVIAIQRG